MAVTSGRNKVFKLIARGTTLDLFDDETIYLSNNVTGLFDLDKLPSDFTRQITIPGTRKNNFFFQHVYDISVDDPYLFKTNEKVIAQFDFDGFYVAQGYMQLNRVNIRENKFVESYEVSVYGLLSSFKRDLQSLTLTEIGEFDKYSHVFSLGNILNSFSGSSYDGGANEHYANSIFTSSVDGHNLGGEIVYCLTDSGKQIAYQSVLSDNILGINNEGIFSGGEVVPQDFKPAMRLDLVLDAIFDQTEYTYESTFLSASRFDDTYVLLDRGLKFPIVNGVDLETFGQIDVGPVSGSSTPLTLTSNVTSSLFFTNVYSDPSFSIVNAQGQYKPFFGENASVGASTALCEVTLNLKVTGSSNPTAYPKITLINGVSTAGLPAGFSVIELPYINDYIRRDFLNTSGDKDYTLTEQFVATFVSGSSYDFKIKYENQGSGGVTVIVGPGGNTESRMKVKTLDQLGELSTIDITNNMPFATNGITSLDFVASMQKKFNLQIYPSKTKPRHFIIETFNNWYKQGDVKNFDSFIDLDSKISVTPANNLGMREVEFGDKLDGDFLAQNFKKQNNREYGKSYFRDTQNFFSDGKLEVTTGFGVSPLRYVAGSGVEGFGVTRLTSFSGIPGTSTSIVCNTAAFTHYHDGTGTLPVFGDRIYTDVNAIFPVIGSTLIRLESSPQIYTISLVGIFGSAVSSCGGGGGGPTS
tara:strand:+ start:15987 stop:18077 length:2091 start_codon:yes stop_codon:yes gene_type:complete